MSSKSLNLKFSLNPCTPSPSLMSSSKKTGNNNWLLGLLAAVHLAAALSHFLLSVVSKAVAKDIHYGNQACVPLLINGTSSNASFHSNSTAICASAKDERGCREMLECDWEYTGLGIDYQMLAGPSFMAVYTTMSIVWGLSADRYNRLHLMVMCSFVFSSAMFLTAFATSFWQLVVLRMILAAGVAGISPIAPGIIYDAFPEKNRALAMGFFHWGIYLGGGLSNAVGKSVYDLHIIFKQGWRGAFLLSGIPGIVLGILMLLTGVDPPRSQKEDFKKVPGKETRARLSVQVLDDVDGEGDATGDEDIDVDEVDVLLQSSTSINAGTTGVAASLWQCCLQPTVLLLGIGACIRQAAGYTWGYNSALYYQTYYLGFDASWWLTIITIFGGSIGVVLGGFISDSLVSRLGLSARGLVLATSQFISFPFALGTLWLNPPFSFFSLLIGYFFAEMWYGVVFAILVELLPNRIRSLGMAVALFVINNFGGNVPVLVSPLTTLTSYRTALTLLYPGSLFASSVLFFMGYLAIWRGK